MKKFSKILSAMMLIALLVTSMMPMAVFAVEPGKITINAPGTGHTLAGQTFKAYKIFELTNYFATEYAYTLVSAFDNFTPPSSTAYDAYVDGLTGGTLPTLEGYLRYLGEMSNGTSSTEVTRTASAKAMTELATNLWAYINDTSNTIPNPVSVTAGLTATTVDITGLELGYYLVFHTINVTNGTGTEDDVEVVAACALTTTAPTATVIPKADAPTLDKQIYDHNKDNATTPVGAIYNNNTVWGDWTDLDIGDTAEFRLVSKVPNMTGYKTYKFIVHDEMSAGLTFTTNSVKVKIGGTDNNNFIVITNTTDDTVIAPYILNGSLDSTFTKASLKNGEFIIAFDKIQFVNLTAGADIIITYSALVNEGAKVDGYNGDASPANNTSDPNPNTAYLEFSNNPYWDLEGDGGDEPTEDTPKDKVDVYTFKIDIFKYTGNLTISDGDGGQIPGTKGTDYKALSGAEFVLKIGNNAIPVVKVTIAGATDDSPAVYRPAIGDAEIATITSPKSGEIVIIGLDAGSYVLEETKPAQGYNLLQDPTIDVTIAHKEPKTGTYEVTILNGSGESVVASPINVLNNAGGMFPGTGGIGRTIFVLVGATMIGAGLISLIVFRKKIFGSK